MTQIVDDILFSQQCEEFTQIAPMLRYVAALNPDASKKEFVAAAVEVGYNPTTAAIQFAQSRRFDCDSYGYSMDAEYRLILN